METVGINDISRRIIGAAIAVHRELGPGLLENSYEPCLAMEMVDRDLTFERQRRLPFDYKGQHIDAHYRLDFLVEGRVVVEIKCVERLNPIHTAQMITYLRLSGCHLGLLINFNVRVLTAGIKRVALDLPEASAMPRLPRDR